MSSLTLIAFCSLAIGASEGDNYSDAHQATMKTGRPMLVMVSTDWCAPCQVMKKTIIPRVKERGLLRRVAFAVVNPDRDKDLAEQLTGGGPVPQLVLYHRTSQGWKRQSLIGGQSVEAVEDFVNQAIAADEKGDKSPDGKPQAPAQKPEGQKGEKQPPA